MNRSPRAPGPRTAARVLLPALLLTALTALTACSSDGDADGGGDGGGSRADGRPGEGTSAPPGPGPSESKRESKPEPEPSAEPSLPDPADGTDRQACADGTCEVRVKEGDVVPVPERYGFGAMTVTSVEAGTLVLSAVLYGTEFVNDSGCAMSITGPSADAPGSIALTCDAGTEGALNGMRLKVAGVADGAAVLRLRPAP
ncbi:hypothetical protein [Streptomyces sp. Z26]|uniref:hypothetical protein n=1 Tax=Streptomyces sp. Z26 TaxID=2500177 RepID=UPI000EF16DFA|nr:hypothetical protein [Streptomyces sp. Z26]RLL66331.1 hypothetical protein D7M15_04900 [Streptomyces sp. Z26]